MGKKSIPDIASDWARDPGDWAEDAPRILGAVIQRTSDDGGICDAAWETLVGAGYPRDEIVETDEDGRNLADRLAIAFLRRL